MRRKKLIMIRKLRRLELAVDDSGNRAEDVAVLEKAVELREEARALMTYMTNFKDSITNMTGGRDEKANTSAIKMLMLFQDLW